MKKIMLASFLLAGIMNVNAQISTSTGGATNVLPNSPTTNTNVGIGTTYPSEKLEVNGYIKAKNVSIGGNLQTETSRNYINLSSDNHGSMLLSSNLYLNDSKFYTAITHPTLSGAAIKIPGNYQIGQNSIEFWTTPVSSVNAQSPYLQESPRMIISPNGNVGIGTTTPAHKLSVNGTIWAKEVKVSLTDAADWVFDTNYKLKPLAEVEKFINENKHLPEVPSAEEFRQNDMNVSQMSNKLLQKIEELTLYAIEQNKKLEEQQKNIAEQHNVVKEQNKVIEELKVQVATLINKKE